MTSDITTVWNASQSRGDWQLEQGGLLTGGDLETAILISLFTDRQARADDDLEGSDRRGWWGDMDSEYPIGSRLWLLYRQKLTTKVAIKAENFASEALSWLVADKVVSSISITAEIAHPNRLNLIIQYQQPGKNKASAKFWRVWES